MVETPSSPCGEYVSAGVASFPCSLPRGHEGPHVAEESPQSLRARAAWVKSRATTAYLEAREILAQFQGPARTTAQSLTVNPSPVPGTPTPPRSPVGDGFDIDQTPGSEPVAPPPTTAQIIARARDLIDELTSLLATLAASLDG